MSSSVTLAPETIMIVLSMPLMLLMLTLLQLPACPSGDAMMLTRLPMPLMLLMFTLLHSTPGAIKALSATLMVTLLRMPLVLLTAMLVGIVWFPDRMTTLLSIPLTRMLLPQAAVKNGKSKSSTCSCVVPRMAILNSGQLQRSSTGRRRARLCSNYSELDLSALC